MLSNRPDECNGFDIVIGNPPYIRRTSICDTDKEWYEKNYDSATRQYDIYLLFIEKGTKSLSKKGHLCYINPIRFFNSDYGFGCRKFLINNASIISVLDISQLSVFQNAMTYPCVLLIGKERTNNNNILYRRLDKLSELQIIDRIKPIITPSNADVQTLTWKSSDKNVVDVTSEGVLTAINPGTATITCA